MVKDVYNVAHFILQGNSFGTQNFYLPSMPAVGQPITTPEPSIKKEDLTSFFTEFTKTIVSVLNQSQSKNGSNRSNNNSHSLSCLMCSGPHLILTCEMVEEYIKAGKYKRNAEEKVVLPSGAWILQDIPGNNFLECIDE